MAAADWLENCRFGHSAGAAGENLYFTTAPSQFFVPGAAVQTWNDEAPGYNYTLNTCTPVTLSESCGHYTQLVWRDTTSLGCARKSCTNVTGPGDVNFGPGTLILCQYDPAGNTGGQRPY